MVHTCPVSPHFKKYTDITQVFLLQVFVPDVNYRCKNSLDANPFV